MFYKSGVFEHIIFCVRVVVAIGVCFGWCSRLRYCVVSEWCFQIHISLQVAGGGGLLCISAKRIDVRGENCFRGQKTKLYIDKLMHFLPQLSDFVPLRNRFYSFREQTA